MCQVREREEEEGERVRERKVKYFMGSQHWFYDSPRAAQHRKM